MQRATTINMAAENPPQELEPASFQELVVFLEAQTWEALKSSGSALIPFIADDCVMIFPGSMVGATLRAPVGIRRVLTFLE